MPILRTPLVDDDGSGTTGTILNNAWQTKLYDAIDADPVVQTVAFNAAHYTTPTAGATWTVTASNYAYTVKGKQVLVSLVINGTGTATGAPVRFHVVLPFAPTSAWQFGFHYSYFNTTPGTGLCFVTPDGKLDLLRDLVGTPFAAGATSIFLQAWYAIP
jgi:hemolysin activation/secretion protein